MHLHLVSETCLGVRNYSTLYVEGFSSSIRVPITDTVPLALPFLILLYTVTCKLSVIFRFQNENYLIQRGCMALGPPEDIHTERSHLDMHYSIEMLVCACVTVTGRCARRVVCVVLALCFESGYPVIGTRSSVSLW